MCDVVRLRIQVVSYEQRQAAESLYRDANSLLYADNKPDEEAIDRVVHKLNIECVPSFPVFVWRQFLLTKCPLLLLLLVSRRQYIIVCGMEFYIALRARISQDKRNKFSRKRLNEDEGDITYINERNRVFNKKVRSVFILILNYSVYVF